MEPVRYSFGTGDRFGKQGKVQLSAVHEINRLGHPVIPVWNKSNREHLLTGTSPADVREEAREAVAANGWLHRWFVDADHVNADNVSAFIEPSDWFTIDVAGALGRPAASEVTEEYLSRVENRYRPMNPSDFARKYLSAVHQAAGIWRTIRDRKEGDFITEISMDEVDLPQKPSELYLFLAELKHLGIEPDLVAPKFPGIFPKGVDYIGDVQEFTAVYKEMLQVLAEAGERLGFRNPVRISVHSGSDKFSIYPVIREVSRMTGTGFHVKTAGTTWLEEVTGLARAGGEGLRIAREIGIRGLSRFDEFSAPYRAVLHIDRNKLPDARELASWSSERFAKTLMHDRSCPQYNPDFRQMIHISYKAAAEMGSEYTDALDYFRDAVTEQVYGNLLEKHLKRLF